VRSKKHICSASTKGFIDTPAPERPKAGIARAAKQKSDDLRAAILRWLDVSASSFFSFSITPTVSKPYFIYFTYGKAKSIGQILTCDFCETSVGLPPDSAEVKELEVFSTWTKKDGNHEQSSRRQSSK